MKNRAEQFEIEKFDIKKVSKKLNSKDNGTDGIRVIGITSDSIGARLFV